MLFDQFPDSFIKIFYPFYKINVYVYSKCI